MHVLLCLFHTALLFTGSLATTDEEPRPPRRLLIYASTITDDADRWKTLAGDVSLSCPGGILCRCAGESTIENSANSCERQTTPGTGGTRVPGRDKRRGSHHEGL